MRVTRSNIRSKCLRLDRPAVKVGPAIGAGRVRLVCPDRVRLGKLLIAGQGRPSGAALPPGQRSGRGGLRPASCALYQSGCWCHTTRKLMASGGSGSAREGRSRFARREASKRGKTVATCFITNVNLQDGCRRPRGRRAELSLRGAGERRETHAGPREWDGTGSRRGWPGSGSGSGLRPAAGSGSGPDRRGQAPKGTGRMPRRHQMAGVGAAISPGELPKEH